MWLFIWHKCNKFLFYFLKKRENQNFFINLLLIKSENYERTTGIPKCC